jgi:hypothetical protein
MKTQLIVCLGAVILFSACEKTEFRIPAVTLYSRVMLSGAFTDGSVMHTTLNRDDLLPHDQPYGELPFVYHGDEFVAEFPKNIVDWVLVALHDDRTNEIVSEKAALLTDEGSIVDTDGISPVAFSVVQGDYMVSVRHRNHLGVISDRAVDFSTGEGKWDFTEGNSGQVEIGDKTWALVPGDVNTDILVNNTDLVLLSPAAAIGHSGTYGDFDVNLDGMVNNTDLLILAPYAAVGYSGSF